MAQPTFDIPQVRGGGFYPCALEKGSRTEQALNLALAERDVQGVSTRKVCDILVKLLGPDYNCGNVKRKEVAMSTVSVRIDEELVSAARAAAKAEFRTVQGQVEFWAKVGRAALDNPDLPASFIAESLMSMAEPREDCTVFVPRSAART